jgi:NAD(P)-dependent dehydrogenase (short-subunit alcohol dehydrogenase family)
MATKAYKPTILITGATDGIGLQTAKKFSKFDVRIFIHGRNEEKLFNARTEIIKRSTNPSLEVECLCYDLSSLTSTKLLVQDVLSKTSELDVLINNAGVFQEQFIITDDNLESTFAINVAAPFILNILLLPLLKKTLNSRILNISSISQGGKIVIDNLQFQKGRFSSHTSYSLSKLYMAAISHELGLRITSDEALVQCCDPGTVNTKMLLAGWGYCGIDVEDANDEFELVTKRFNPADHNKYFVNRRESRCTRDVYDDELRLQLWNELEKITGISL